MKRTIQIPGTEPRKRSLAPQSCLETTKSNFPSIFHFGVDIFQAVSLFRSATFHQRLQISHKST